MAKEKEIKPGDKCLDSECNGKFLALICSDDTCGNTVHPKDGYKLRLPSAPKDEGDLCDLILRHANLLTCYNCGETLENKAARVQYIPVSKFPYAHQQDDRAGVLHIDPGRNNYPREPDEPAVAYFECIECAEKEKLSKIQRDLISSFLVGHWKEISESEHGVAFERILETLNPGALRAVRNLQKGVR